MNNVKDSDFVETTSCVYTENGEWIPTDQVEFVDISEDFQGFDIMTFMYNGKKMQSRITTRPV